MPGSRAARISREADERRDAKRRKGENGEAIMNGKSNGRPKDDDEEDSGAADQVGQGSVPVN